jgi:DNA-binding SARP family transcriptional activator
VFDREARVRILGRVELEVAGRPVQVVSSRQRELLAVLALSVGQAVPVEAIARAIWGDRASVKSRAAVHTVAFRLRKILGAEVLRTIAGGYVLRLPEDSVDLFRFRALVRQARSDAPDREHDLLTQALALWRDEPFVDLSCDWLHRSVAPRLLDEWFSVLERQLDLRLASGRHGEVAGELQTLVAKYPLRETLWARLILAMYRSGRQAEGFAAYHSIAATLREEYGADPGEELSRAYQLMLHGGNGAGPAGSGVGAARRLNMLPRDLETFVARSKEVAELLAAGGEGPAVVCVVEGMAGVGKSALAVHAAHRLAERFPDGQLFLDLHAFSPGRAPLIIGEALARLLASVGVDRGEVPADEEAAAALWRGVLANRRILLVLDNVVDSAQVRPLLPGTGGCLAIVTSRRRLTGLDGVRTVPVGLPAEDEAAELFIRASGRPAPDSEVAEVVRLCGRLPLALATAAARLRRDPALTVAALADRLRNRRLHELRAEDRGVASVFAQSVDGLPPDHRDLLVLISLCTSAPVDRYAAAALCGVSPEVAEAMLDELADRHLLDEHYQPHDLLRLYCVEELGRRIPDEYRSAATSGYGQVRLIGDINGAAVPETGVGQRDGRSLKGRPR